MLNLFVCKIFYDFWLLVGQNKTFNFGTFINCDACVNFFLLFYKILWTNY